jgi:hypothetical protein
LTGLRIGELRIEDRSPRLMTPLALARSPILHPQFSIFNPQ